MTTTPLAPLIRHLAAHPGDEAVRMMLLARLALFDVVMPADADGAPAPEAVTTRSGRFLLVHSDEAALADGAPRPVVWLPLRELGTLLERRDTGVVLDPTTQTPHLLTAGELGWFASLGRLGQVVKRLPDEGAAGDPSLLPPAFHHALDAALAPVAGLLDGAWLRTVASPRPGAAGPDAHLHLAGLPPPHEAPLRARLAIAAAFLAEGASLALSIGAAPGGAGFRPIPLASPDLPLPPGSDPDRPPKLR